MTLEIALEADGEWDSSRPWDALVRRAAEAAIAESAYPDLARSGRPVELSVRLTSDEQVRAPHAMWRGMRHLISGEDSEPTLREEIEEAIDEAEESHPVAGDLTPTERQMLRNLLHFGEQTAGDIKVTRGDIIAVPSDITFDALVRAF